MYNINFIKNYKIYQFPVVLYTHYLLNRPVKVIVYKRFPFKGLRTKKIFAKLMAMVHDYILCYEQEYGIQYGVTYNLKVP